MTVDRVLDAQRFLSNGGHPTKSEMKQYDSNVRCIVNAHAFFFAVCEYVIAKIDTITLFSNVCALNMLTYGHTDKVMARTLDAKGNEFTVTVKVLDLYNIFVGKNSFFADQSLVIAFDGAELHVSEVCEIESCPSEKWVYIANKENDT